MYHSVVFFGSVVVVSDWSNFATYKRSLPFLFFLLHLLASDVIKETTFIISFLRFSEDVSIVYKEETPSLVYFIFISSIYL